MMNWNLKVRIGEVQGTQRSFAQKLGLSEPVLSRIIHGRKTPDAKLRLKISRALRVREAEIFEVPR